MSDRTKNTRRGNGEGTVTQKANGKWVAIMPRKPGTPKWSMVHGTEREARQWLRDRLVDARFAELHPELVKGAPKAGGPTVADVLDEYVRMHVNGSTQARSTQEGKRAAVNRAKKYLGLVAVSALDASRYERAEIEMVADELGWSAIKGVRTVINETWKKRRLGTSPALALDRPANVQVGKFEKSALTAEQREQLVAAAAEHRMRAAIIVSAYLGLRPGEVLGLCWDCVDLDSDTPTLTVRRQVGTVANKPVLLDRVKTKSSARTLLLKPRVTQALRDHRSVQAAEIEAARSWTDMQLVFPTQTGTPTAQRNWADQLALLLTHAGLPRITPHELRHTAATLMIESGMTPHAVADVLGHATDELVQTTYRHRGQVVRASVEVPDF